MMAYQTVCSTLNHPEQDPRKRSVLSEGTIPEEGPYQSENSVAIKAMRAISKNCNQRVVIEELFANNLNYVQDKFEVNIGQLPDFIEINSYIKLEM